MPSITVINYEEHGHKSWIRRDSYEFTKNDTVIPLLAEELSTAVQSMPVAFIQNGDSFTLVALQGLNPGQNLMVSPTGQWLMHYVPIAYRYNPFLLLSDPSGKLVLCMDEDSGLLVNDHSGQAFFDEFGKPTQQSTDIVNRLTQIESSRKYTQKICDLLDKLKLIQPWPITLKTDEASSSIDGLFRIDEAQLNSLTAENLVELRDCGALPVIYCQLLSMQHLGTLQALHKHRLEATASTAGIMSETFNFGGL